MKKRDVIVDDDNDDGVRTSASQNHATAILCTEEFFLRTQYTVYSSPLNLAEVGGRRDIDSHCNIYRQSG